MRRSIFAAAIVKSTANPHELRGPILLMHRNTRNPR
jgi:hypothetical protein